MTRPEKPRLDFRKIRIIFGRELRDQLRDRRTLFMVMALPVLLYPALGIGMLQMAVVFSERPRTVVVLGSESLPQPKLIEGSAFAARWFADPGDAIDGEQPLCQGRAFRRRRIGKMRRAGGHNRLAGQKLHLCRISRDFRLYKHISGPYLSPVLNIGDNGQFT